MKHIRLTAWVESTWLVNQCESTSPFKIMVSDVDNLHPYVVVGGGKSLSDKCDPETFKCPEARLAIGTSNRIIT